MTFAARFGGSVPAALFAVGLACGPAGSGDASHQLVQWGYAIPASFRAGHASERLSPFDVLCVGVYRLNARGELYRRPDLRESERKLLTSWRKQSVTRRLVPLISLRGAKDGAALLRHPQSRTRAAHALSKLVRVRGYDGLHIDFEFLTAESTDGYVAFLDELRERLDGRSLSIAAFPPLHGTPEEQAFWDARRIEPYVDEVVFMTYDYHFYKPGPVTHLYWARQNLEIALEDWPREKVYLGIPSYGYSWEAGRRRPRIVTEAGGLEQCERFGCERSDAGVLRVNRKDRTVYFSDAYTYARMTQLAREFRLKGTAVWRIGFEKHPPEPAPQFIQ